MNQLSLAGTQLEHFHICAFFDSRAQEYDVLVPFYQEAVAQGEKNLHLLEDTRLVEHREELARHGIDVPHCEACGQLELRPWRGNYLDRHGRFDREQMLTRLRSVCSEAAEAGFPRVRLMGDMDWVFGEAVHLDEILEYEAEVNSVLAEMRQPAVCVYDIARLTGSMMMDLLRTHPLTLINGVVQENPFYTPAPQMLQELRSRKLRADAHAT
jgi:hypothetical protein